MPNAQGITVVLTPLERKLIREALNELHRTVVLTPVERDVYAQLLRRIPAPDGER